MNIVHKQVKTPKQMMNFGHISMDLLFQNFTSSFADCVKTENVQKDASQSGPQVTGQ